MKNILKTGLVAMLSCFLIPLQAQYFGQNKPNYEHFDFKVHKTENFEIYEYLNNEELLKSLAANSEKWYRFHQRVLGDTIKTANPIIFYNDHADFQQTNAISGSIGVGTGGVTEAFKNRVILPLTLSNSQNSHVIGHELVHAFQYNMILNGDSTSLKNLGNLPLWMVEGLAEYLSIGSVDAHTAMWMRDAVLNKDVPDLKKLNNPKYFPYRYGQAFWAFLTGLKGDEIIEPFFVSTAKYGLERACILELDMGIDNLSALWVKAIENHFGNFLKDKKEDLIGKKLISEDNAGRMNVSPVISPNGRYVIFLSEKDLFTTDLFLADARTGKLIRKVASKAKDGHIDDYNYLESSGSWSPDSKRFVFVGVSKGRNILIIKEALSGNTVEEIRIEEVPAFSNPLWSPDGKTIVFSGLVNGQPDLYAYDIKKKKVSPLTNDRYSEIHPSWSPEGNFLVFSTDRLSMGDKATIGAWTYNLAKLDIASNTIENINVFPGAENLNPVVDTAGNILFLSNRDGYRNIYRYEQESGKVFQLSDFITGVTGITPFSPAISISRKRDNIIYTHYNKNRYTLYKAKPEAFLNKEVPRDSVDFAAAQLPRLNPALISMVDSQLSKKTVPETAPSENITTVKYKPQFKLDYLGGGAGVGVGTSQTFGTTTGAAGGVDMLFSDILGNNQLFTSLALNGEIADFGGALAYINRKNRINWGASISHIPYRSTYGGFAGIETLNFEGGGSIETAHYTFLIDRLFEEKAGLFAQLPFSKALRVEASSYYARYSNKKVQLDNYYDVYNRLVDQDRTKLESAPGFNLWNVGGALVGDNSYFGLTAPLKGYRFRLGAEQYFGEYEFLAPTADFRAYHFFKPAGIAFRILHYGRYGKKSDDIFPLYLGSPWYIRGFSSNNIEDILYDPEKVYFEQNPADPDNPKVIHDGNNYYEELQGSKLLVANFEVRIPFTGPERLAAIKSKFLLTDLNFFIDGGVAWTDFNQFKGDRLLLGGDGKPIPIIDPSTGLAIHDKVTDEVLFQTVSSKVQPYFSAGASVRINLFGAMVIEPFFAIPLVKDTKGSFGLNFIPGW